MLNFIRRRRDAKQAEIERMIRDAVEARAKKLQAENFALSVSVNRLNTRVAELETENTTLRATVRAQTEADLVLVSLKVISAAVNGEAERAKSMAPQHDALRAALGAMPAPYTPYAAGTIYGSLLGNTIGNLWPH